MDLIETAYCALITLIFFLWYVDFNVMLIVSRIWVLFVQGKVVIGEKEPFLCKEGHGTRLQVRMT